MSIIRAVYRVLLISRINIFSWLRVQQILVGVFLSSVLYIAVFGLVLSRIIDETYISFIIPGVLSIYSATLTTIPIGTLVHTAAGRSDRYLYALPIPRSSIIVSRIIVGILIVLIASIISIASYWILSRSFNPIYLLAIIPSIALTIAISMLYASLAFIIRDPLKYFTIVPPFSSLLIVLSTAYYPIHVFNILPQFFIYIIEYNPISISSELGRLLIGIASGDLIFKFIVLILEIIVIMLVSGKITFRKLEF